PNGVTFTCNTGYVLNGAAAATCQADGTWSNPVPTCIPVQCPTLIAPTNGQLRPTGAVSYPNGIIFTCNPGYVLNGAAAASCQADGTWSNPVPTCTRIQCPALIAPSNGAISPTGVISYPNGVTFTCNTGYVLNGAAAATCQADGTWSNPVPTCTPRQCPTLTAPNNGNLSPLGPHVYPNGVTFTCNPGYVRNGAAAATCQADGTWSNSAPTCTPIQCPGRTAPTNGAVSPTGAVSYPNGVIFNCNTGYVLNGAAAATCQADGTWSNPVPTCTPNVQCPTRSAPINGAVSPTGVISFPNGVTFTCNPGYVLNGAAAATCQADGTWSNPVPTCTPVQCSSRTAPTNGVVSPAGAVSYPNGVTFTCNPGYVLNGAADATCQADGTWSNPVPTCTPRPCPTLTAPTNGALSPLGPHVYPNGVIFTCNTGYVRNGAAAATCQADGTWSNPVPICTPVQCLTLSAPTNGAVTPTGAVSYPNSVTFTCNTGYQLNGFSAATCQADGTWSNPVPTCTPVQCPARTAPINGAVSPTGAVSYPNGVTFTCNTGYVRNGAAAATCQADGTWSNPVPTCTQRQCPTLTAPPNGALSTTATSYQTVVTFTCNTGYMLNGAADATCQVDGTWSNPFPTCTPRPCPTLTAPTNGALSPLGPHVYPNGVTFTCNTGYVRNGAAAATCQADGTWSNPVPTCTPVQCLTLTAPTNGALSPTGLVSYPNSVTFTCNTGYQLNGFSAATCQADGTWSNPVPTCTQNQCPTLTVPTNGALSTTSTSYQTVVTFICHTGYVLNGDSNTTCQADGTWTNPVPTCTRIFFFIAAVQCPTLTDPTNGMLRPTGVISYPNSVSFTCNTGYQLIGFGAATCQADGTWSNSVPTCTPIQCPTLTTPTNGAVSPTEVIAYPNSVTFTCNTGYQLNGFAAATCQADGTWSNSVPTCTVQCPTLIAPSNGAVSPTGAVSYPNGVTFTCNPGYVLNGAAAATCQADGTWSNPVPTCTPIRCPTLTAPANGALSTTVASYQTVVSFICNTGYVRNGFLNTTCQADGTWTNPAPTCTPVQCPALTAPNNGTVSPTGAVPYPNGVTFTCNTGYVLNGAAAATCQADGTWSNPVPTCTPVQCPNLLAPTNGAVSPTGTIYYPSSVTFTCNTGYVLNGADTATCQADGTWSDPVPICPLVQCRARTAPTNGAVSPTGAVSYPNEVTFTCHPGYVLNGAAAATCQADGTWSNPVPTCTPVQCPARTAPNNGAVSPTGAVSYPDVVTFTCNTGYVLNGATAARCQADRTWSNPVPTCTPIQCPTLIAPTYGAVSPTGAVSYPNGVTFTCNSGFELNGTTAATCQADGTWDNPVPTCTRIQCLTLTSPTNGAVTPTGAVYYSNGVTFTCNPGYVLNGAAAATCQADGTWSNQVPTCTPVQCPARTAPNNGAVSPTGAVSYPDGVTFTCNPGYVLNGAAAATCQADETWSNPVPTCTPIQCPTLIAPTYGAVSPTGAVSYPNGVTFTCNSGFELNGTTAATCQADGTWDNPVPTCTLCQVALGMESGAIPDGSITASSDSGHRRHS
ncbi:PREDICTED: sushi, von Willebrand factor type A, EGF and pentraxin domain-containing protein 1-like, partial [Branchiostoma belcheri]|uniref:Sushi, von Willebrand factor type A, EGF and pentraxin domain-containing protein 1-like n=1 Tax=Branchiostoma belcheri TaxID=7741 RepID=A0A6P4Z9P1_BRABE